MKRKTIITILVIILLLSQTTNFVSANVQPIVNEKATITPQSIRTYTISFSRESNTKGIGKLTVLSSTTPSSIKATIRLQVANKGTNSYQNSSVSPVTVTVYKKASLTKHFSFPITTTKKYRVKATVVETVSGNTKTYTYYKTLS